MPDTLAIDMDILGVLKARPKSMTYVIANWLRADHEEYKGLKTSTVLRRLKALERENMAQVCRVPSIYAVQICWDLKPNPRIELPAIFAGQLE